MKLFICDHLGCHKTTAVMEKWFEKRGHEVKYDFYYNPVCMEWCDVAFFAWADPMCAAAIDNGWGGSKDGQQIMHQYSPEQLVPFTVKKKPLFMWAVDIEIWNRDYNSIRDYSQLAGIFYMSKSYFDYMDRDVHFAENFPNLPIRKMPLSLHLDDWTYKERKHGKKIGVIGEQWWAKNPFLLTQMMAMLPNDYTVDVLGNWNAGVWRWAEEQFWYEVRSYGLEGRVTNPKWMDAVAGRNVIDEWLEDKDYLVTFSGKDAFSIVVGEAMAKGIKAFPHDFMGAPDIWGKYVWKTLPELVDRIQHEEYNSAEYRKYIADNYSDDVVLTKLEEVFNAAISS